MKNQTPFKELVLGLACAFLIALSIYFFSKNAHATPQCNQQEYLAYYHCQGFSDEQISAMEREAAARYEQEEIKRENAKANYNSYSTSSKSIN